MSGDRQLQHRRVLALDQPREQYHLSVGKFQRIMMDHGTIRIDLPEAREPLSDFLVWENANAERWFVFDVVVERDLGARQQANRDMRLADGSEATGDGIAEFGRYQLVLDLGRSGCDVVQTVVTHGRAPLTAKDRNGHPPGKAVRTGSVRTGGSEGVALEVQLRVCPVEADWPPAVTNCKIAPSLMGEQDKIVSQPQQSLDHLVERLRS
jgi:hypothetical protein